MSRDFWRVLAAAVMLSGVVSVFVVGRAQTPTALESLTTALTDSEDEVRTGIMPAVAGVLTAVLVIGIGAGVVTVMTRR